MGLIPMEPDQKTPYAQSQQDLTTSSSHQNELLYRFIFESVWDYAIFMMTPTGEINAWNPGTERILGYSSSEIMGKHLQFLYPTEEQELAKASEELEKVRSEGRLEKGKKFIGKDGSTYRVIITLVNLRDHVNKDFGFACLVHPITDQKADEENLRQRIVSLEEFCKKAEASVANLNCLIQNAPVGICFLDNQFKFLHLNQLIAEAGHASIEEQLGQPVEQFAKPIWPSLKPILDAVYTDGKIIKGVIFSAKDVNLDKEEWVECCYFPIIDQNQKKLGVGVIAEDVTERFRLQQELRISETRYRTFVSTLAELTWTANTSGTLHFAGRWTELTGEVENEDKQFRDLLSIFEEDRVSLQELWESALSKNEPFEKEFRWFDRSNNLNYSNCRAVPIFAPDRRLLEWVGVFINITTQKQAQIILDQTLAQCKAITDNATTAIFLESMSDGCLFVNPAAERITGYSFPELKGKSLHHILHSFHFDGSFMTEEDCPIQKVFFQQQTLRGYETYLQAKDGRFFPVICQVSPLKTMSNPNCIVVEVIDNTEKKQTQQLLQETEDQFRLLVDYVSDYALVMLDREGRIVTWNQGAERMFGYQKHEIVGQPIRVLLPVPSDQLPHRFNQELMQNELDRAIEKGIAHGEEWRLRKNGQKFFAGYTTTPIYNREGILTSFANITQDLTASHRQKEFLHSIIDQALQAIITIDQNGSILSYNRAAETMFGYKEVEVIGKNVRLLMPEPYASQHNQFLNNYLHTGEKKVIGSVRELKAKRKSGEIFPMDLSITECRVDEEIFFTGMVRDISRQKKVEEQLRQSQKMEAIGQLAGGIAHDFNNLLTIINGYCELLLNDNQIADDSRQKLNEIHQAGEHAANLTRQLLAFSRKQILEPKIFDLNDIVVSVTNLLRRLIGENILIELVLQKDIGQIYVDPGKLEQVLINLAINARDAMPMGGRLLIETHSAVIDDTYCERYPDCVPGDYVLLAITDTGVGIDPETMKHIFEPFFTTKAPGKGTGLGLAMVFGLIKQSGGHISVYSELKIGTTFKIYLPIYKMKGTVNKQIPPVENLTIPRGGTESILLVEDEDSVRKLAKIVLENSGYKILLAKSGKEAIEILSDSETNIDLMISDVVMPEVSGKSLLKSVKELRPGMLVMFMSGYTDDAVMRQGFIDPDIPFLHKPFTPNRLKQVVRDLLDLRANK